MRLLLLLFFFVAGTTAFTVFFKNNCQKPIQVARFNNVTVQAIIPLAANSNATDTVGVNEDIKYSEQNRSYATFTPAAGKRTNFTIYKDWPSNEILKLKPDCASGQPCPAFRCGLAPDQPDCKKDGDADFSNQVSGSRPNTMGYFITYCAAN